MKTSAVILLLVVSLLLALPQANGQAPTPVVERITTHFGRTTHVSLFSNHVVVVAVHSETEDFVHQATLSFDEYMVYLQTIVGAADKIGNEPVTSDVEARDSATKLIINVGPDAPRVLKYSPLASLKLEAARIDSVVDDLENRALSVLPGEYEIKHWEPEIGDCVKLRQGGEACVTAIGDDDGSIVLLQAESSVSYTVPMESRSEVILAIIGPSP